MTDYKKLVDALRCELHYTSCPETNCKYICHDTFCDTYRLMIDAAAAIEELDAEETRLLLITSELQDKVVELEEELNDADVAADDNARQIEELQAEVKQLEPKRGEWIPIQIGKWRGHKCSCCGIAREVPCSSSDGIPQWKYCPECGAMTEVQDG